MNMIKLTLRLGSIYLNEANKGVDPMKMRVGEFLTIAIAAAAIGFAFCVLLYCPCKC